MRTRCRLTTTFSLQKTLPQKCFIKVPQLDSGDVSAILESWLEAGSRALQPAQMTFLREACEKCRLPLFTKIAFDETKRWRSYTDVQTVRARMENPQYKREFLLTQRQTSNV